MYKSEQIEIARRNLSKYYVRIREEREALDKEKKNDLKTIYWTLIGREGRYKDKGKKVEWLNQGVVERKDILPFVKSASMEHDDLTEIYEYPYSYRFLRYDKALKHYERVMKNNMRTIVAHTQKKLANERENTLEEEHNIMKDLLRSTYYESFIAGNVEKGKLAKLRYESYARLAKHYLEKENYDKTIQYYGDMENDLYDTNYLSVFAGIRQEEREKINRGLATCYFSMQDGKAREEYREMLLKRYFDVSKFRTFRHIKKQLSNYYQLLLKKEQIALKIHEVQIPKTKQRYYVITYRDEQEAQFLSVLKSKRGKLSYMNVYGSRFDDGEKVVLTLKYGDTVPSQQSFQNVYKSIVPYGENTYAQTRGDIMLMQKNGKWLYCLPDSEKHGDKAISERHFQAIP